MTPTPHTRPTLTPSQRRSRLAGGLFAGLALCTGVTALPSHSAHAAPAPGPVVAQALTPPSPVAVRTVARASRGGARTAPIHYVTRTVAVGPSFSGKASWYGPRFQGRRTANGERFDTNDLTAASKTLPFGTRLRVCRHDDCVVVRVNDRGPYVGHRILDLSRAASRAIGFSGVAYVTATPVETRRIAVKPVVRRAAVKPTPVVLAPKPVPAADVTPEVADDRSGPLAATAGFGLLSLGGFVRGRRLR